MHLSPAMWRMLPAFWVLGLVAIAAGLPLARGRVRPNPYWGLTIGRTGARDDVWCLVNQSFGRDLFLAGVRLLAAATLLALVDWRASWHYLFVTGSVILAEAMVLAARWYRLSRELRREWGDDPGSPQAR